MGACFDRLRCEVFQNLFLSPMNTGFVRPAVATVLTACGIETLGGSRTLKELPEVATVLTACGIETKQKTFYCGRNIIFLLQQYLPLAVLKLMLSWMSVKWKFVSPRCNSTYRLRY